MSEQELTHHQNDFIEFVKKQTATAMIKLAGYLAGIMIVGGVGGFFFIKAQAEDAVSKVGNIRVDMTKLQNEVDGKADLKLVIANHEQEIQICNIILTNIAEIKEGQDKTTTLFIEHLSKK